MEMSVGFDAFLLYHTAMTALQDLQQVQNPTCLQCVLKPAKSIVQYILLGLATTLANCRHA